MIEKLGYANEDDFIRRGLGLDPTTVDYALITLRLIKPQWAMPFDTAAKIGIALAKHGRAEDAPRDEKGRYQKSKAGNASLGGYNTAPHIRARLERDGKTELLAQVERGEISAHAAAKEAGYRKQAVCHLPTVPGFLKAAQAHLSPEQRLELKEAL